MANEALQEHLEESCLNYFLEAWIEGHYARHCHERVETCPYDQNTEMAVAWTKGWHTRDAMASPPF